MASCPICGTSTETHWPNCPHSTAYDPAYGARAFRVERAVEPHVYAPVTIYKSEHEARRTAAALAEKSGVHHTTTRMGFDEIVEALRDAYQAQEQEEES